MKLADSSFLVGLIEEDDFHHEAAVAIFDEVSASGHGPIVVDDSVLLETLQVMERRHGVLRSQAATTLARVCSMQEFRIDPAALQALRAVAGRPALGFVDALLAEQDLCSGSGILSFDRTLLVHMERLRTR